MSMKQIAGWALDVCHAQGVQYAEIRIVDDRQRALSTKNGKVGYVSDSESLGAGIRVLANGAWGFAATEDLTREGIEITAGRALEIARSSARVEAGRRSARARKGVCRRLGESVPHRSIHHISGAEHRSAAED